MSGHEVPGGVVKVVELVGSSDSSFSDAVRNAVRVASQSLRNIQGVDVIGSSATVGDDGELTLYKVHCKVAFLVESGGGTGANSEEGRSTGAKGGSEPGSAGGTGAGSVPVEAQTTRPTDEPPPGITAETISSVDDGVDD